MIRNFPRYFLQFIVLVLLQVLVLNNIHLGGFINPYLYILFILLLPFDTPSWIVLFLGFFLGLSVDLFMNTLGMHASATVFMAFLRPTILKIIAPRDGYEPGTLPRIAHQGAEWFIRYALILTLGHHLFLFFAEAFHFTDFFATLLRVLLSTLFSALLIIMSQYFIYRE
jgi:rod shape-determining protein MreD